MTRATREASADGNDPMTLAEGRRMTVRAFLSRASLAHELDVSESTIDEMVRRGVLPRPLKISPGCIRWRWEAVDMALASLEGRPHDAGALTDMKAIQDAIQASKDGRRGRAS